MKKEPPSLFDSLDLFGQTNKEPRAVKEPIVEEVVVTPSAVNVNTNLTGTGPLRNLMNTNFLQYTAYVICSRAIPAVEDGLKPVQRRILHSMWETDKRHNTKVANVVGNTIHYHPHGDVSIADALVVLTNKLAGEGNGYLINGQGNFGNIYTGAPAAAMRYIECQLTDLARKEVFNPKTTDYVPNYTGEKMEPVLLPAKIPLLLMLGAEGIAVGLSTSILPHNFIELLEAEIALIQKKPFALFPDFQLGGIMDTSEYKDGVGKVKVRAVIEEQAKNRLVITQLPWGETTDSIIDSIDEAVKKKKVSVRHIHDLTSENVEIEMELTLGADPKKVIQELYAFTNCEKSISSRPVVLCNGRPMEMTVSQILQNNVDRLMMLTRREFEIRLQELSELFQARTMDRIFIEERIYKRIETEKTEEGVKATVLTGFIPFRKELRRDITDDDIKRLLSIPIRRISQFDINKNRHELEDIVAEEKEVAKNLAGLRAYVIKYLKGLIKEYSKKYPRHTVIATTPFKQVDVRAITASELTIRHDKDGMFIGSGVKTGDEIFKCSSLDKLIFVWKDGRYKMMPVPDKFFVDKDLLTVFVFNPEKDREKEYTCIYEEPTWSFTYIKRFTFGGMINNKEYTLAPKKSKLLFFQSGCPDIFYVKFKPFKNQRLFQQTFEPKKQVEKGGEMRDSVEVRGAGAKGIQMTTRPVARIATAKPTWWDDAQETSKGVLL